MKLQRPATRTPAEIRKFLSGGHPPIFKFKNVGDRIRGAIAEPPKLLPQTEYFSTEPKLDDDGKPVMQLLLVLSVGEGRQRVYIDKPLMREKLWRAIEDSGADDLTVGGIIEIIRIEECQNGGTAHDFEVTFDPPADDSKAPF